MSNHSTATKTLTEVSWQPIESAPKDGTKVLVANEFVMHVASWSDFIAEFQIGTNNDRYVCDPTHWMHLPPPPENV